VARNWTPFRVAEVGSRFIPTGGNMPPAKEARAVSPKAEEQAVREAEKVRDAEAAEAAKSTQRQANPQRRGK